MMLHCISWQYGGKTLTGTPWQSLPSNIIGYVVVIVVVNTKIAKSGDLHVGTWASSKHNEYIKFGGKLASICLESSGMAYKHHK